MIPTRETFASDREDLVVQVTDDGSRTLVKAGTDDAFHSGCGALSETRHVYLHGSGVAERFRRGLHARVLEVGLGTSMAALVTIDDALRCDASLEYVAIETDWISAATLRLLAPETWVTCDRLVADYLAFRQSLGDRVGGGVYRWQFDSRRVLRVIIADVRGDAIGSEAPFDAIYYDPFCPETAPELWTRECMERMRRLISADGRLATYSCSRAVREALRSAGWRPRRVPGPPGGKREVLVADVHSDGLTNGLY